MAIFLFVFIGLVGIGVWLGLIVAGLILASGAIAVLAMLCVRILPYVLGVILVIAFLGLLGQYPAIIVGIGLLVAILIIVFPYLAIHTNVIKPELKKQGQNINEIYANAKKVSLNKS